MIIGGLQKFSLLDYPGYLAAIIFTKKCNFRCQFCYNPMLVWPQKGHHLFIKEDDLFVFLKERFGKLDAVVITGGEPTMHADLPKFLKKIRKIGYKIKLDTNGANPDMLQKIIKENLIDYVAMDIKAPKEKYQKITGVKINFAKIQKSVKIIRERKIPYEFRTTIVPGLLNLKDIEKMGKIIKGAEKWYLQQFKNDTEIINKDLKKTKKYSQKDLKDIYKAAKKHVNVCEIR
jgi:pyruvate formate lyase activating enzyme